MGDRRGYRKSGNCSFFCEVNQLKIARKANIMTSMRCRDTINTASVALGLRVAQRNMKGDIFNGKPEAESHLQDLLW